MSDSLVSLRDVNVMDMGSVGEEKPASGLKITQSILLSLESISVLGQVAAAALKEHGQVCFYIDQEGAVSIAPLREVSLDAIPEPDALQVLLDAGYDDQALEFYLKGRDARRKWR